MTTTTYPLDVSTVRRLVPASTPGTYRLGEVVGGTFVPRYFGRSDTSLQHRLLVHARRGLDPRFAFTPAPNIYDAFRRECAAWHLQMPQTRNRIHPAAPAGWRFHCPYCAMASDDTVTRLAQRLSAANHQAITRRWPNIFLFSTYQTTGDA